MFPAGHDCVYVCKRHIDIKYLLILRFAMPRGLFLLYNIITCIIIV